MTYRNAGWQAGLLLALVPAWVGSQSASGASQSRDPLSGVVVNQTMTVSGHDFYSAFASAWRDSDGAARYSVAIFERPNARRGTHVWIEYQRNKIFETILPPSRAQIRELGVEAATVVQEAVIRTNVDQLLYADDDLAKDEI